MKASGYPREAISGLQFLHYFPGHFLSLFPALPQLPRLCLKPGGGPTWGRWDKVAQSGADWEAGMLRPLGGRVTSVRGAKWLAPLPCCHPLGKDSVSHPQASMCSASQSVIHGLAIGWSLIVNDH